MAQKQTESGWLAQIWGTWWGLIVIACLFLIPTILCALLVWAGRFPAGFDEYAPSVPGAEREMTFRAWIDLLLIPLSLAAGAVLLGWLADRRETAAGARRAQADQEAQERRLLADREIQMDRSRESVWQTYLDRVAALLRGEWHESGGGFLEANVIRAQTLTTLRLLDGERKGSLLRFLYESGLIGRLAPGGMGPPGVVEALIDLRGADLVGASLPEAELGGINLRGADLGRARLRGAFLYQADLSGVELCDADLSHARLRGANLWGANLSGADLNGANLSGADLSHVRLRGANLWGANLTDAELDGANLSGAILSGADLTGAHVTGAQLDLAKSLEGTTLPIGAMHD